MSHCRRTPHEDAGDTAVLAGAQSPPDGDQFPGVDPGSGYDGKHDRIEPQRRSSYIVGEGATELAVLHRWAAGASPSTGKRIVGDPALRQETCQVTHRSRCRAAFRSVSGRVAADEPGWVRHGWAGNGSSCWKPGVRPGPGDGGGLVGSFGGDADAIALSDQWHSLSLAAALIWRK